MALTSLDKDRAGGDSPTTNESPEPTGEPNESFYDETGRLPLDLLFGLLSNQRRRWALTYLTENGRETTLSDLAEHIASVENNKPAAAINSTERKRVYVGLYQVHLPKMDDADVIEYNQSRGTIELRPEANQLLNYLTKYPTMNQPKPLRQHLVPSTLLTLWKKYRDQP